MTADNTGKWTGVASCLHQTGKFYGDSVVLDFTIRSGPVRLKLTKSK